MTGIILPNKPAQAGLFVSVVANLQLRIGDIRSEAAYKAPRGDCETPVLHQVYFAW